jgi:hypothetical protein
MPHAWMHAGFGELRPLLGREERTDFLENLHAERDRLSEELLHLGRLRGRVRAVERELAQLGLRRSECHPRLLLLVTMLRERGGDGLSLIVRESETLLEMRHAVRGAARRSLALRILRECDARAGQEAHERKSHDGTSEH